MAFVGFVRNLYGCGGNGVTNIGRYAFYGCSKLKTVYYTGTEREWTNVSIDNGNWDLTSATHYYYSETQPTSTGNYWHYDENGDIVVW